MNFRQTAALGLITLLLGGNTTLPYYADAATIALGSPSQAKHQLGNMIDQHLMMAVAEQQQLLHPMHKRHTLLDRLNPFNYLSRSAPPITIARAVPLKKAMRAMANPANNANSNNDVPLAQKIARAQETIHSNNLNATPAPGSTGKRGKLSGKAIPLTPEVSANPALTTAPSTEAETETQQPTQESTAAPEPAKISYTQILPPALQKNPTFERIYQTYDPQNWNVAHKPSAEETFQLLAASPLDKLALQTQSTSNMLYAPGLDSNSPDISTHTEGSVKVLKSGISQKVTSVDLPIGKAEVLYLSRPASRVSVSNPDVASAVVISPTQIQLVGKAVGVANLLVWGDMVSPDHTVVDISVHRDVSVLVNQLKYVDSGIQIVPMAAEDTVILTGQAETRESAQLAIEMAKAFFNKQQPGAAANNNGISSQAPGSAVPGISMNVINLIKVKGEPSTKVELVRQRMHEIDPNIRVDVVPGPEGNEKVILTGRVASASIASKALNLASVFYGQPGLKMVTAQGGNDFTRMQVSSNSSSSGSSSTTTLSSGAAAGGANVLQGSVMTDATGNVISMLEIAQKPQVRCSIKFLELKKTALNAMGNSISGARGATKFVSWSGVHSSAPANPISVPSSQSPPGAGWVNTGTRDALGSGWRAGTQSVNSNWNEVFQNGITQVFTINNTMTAAIQALQERRQIRTLAEPTLTIMSGEQGSFLAGGEIPIAFLGGNGQISIEFHEYGIRLNLLPNITDDGKIQMQVSPEVSAVDTSVSVQGVPGFTTRRMSTSLIIEPNQSFALAGLYNQEDTDSVSRLPGAGSLPVLGSFFRNKWKNHSNTELVVLIKPEVIYSQTGPTGTQTGMAPAETPKISEK